VLSFIIMDALISVVDDTVFMTITQYVSHNASIDASLTLRPILSRASASTIRPRTNYYDSQGHHDGCYFGHQLKILVPKPRRGDALIIDCEKIPFLISHLLETCSVSTFCTGKLFAGTRCSDSSSSFNRESYRTSSVYR